MVEQFEIKSKTLNIYQIIFPMLIIILEIVHWVTYSFQVDYGVFGMYSIVMLIFFTLIFKDNAPNEDIKKSIQLYIIGSVVALISVLLIAILTHGMNDIFNGVYRLGGDGDEDLKIGYARMNPNTLAYFSITALSLLLYTKDIFKSKVIKILLSVLLTIVGILTTSRTFIILFVLLLISNLLLSRSNKERIAFVLIIFVLSVSASLFFPTYVSSFVERYVTRFEEGNIETGGGRTEIFKEYNRFLLDNPNKLIYGTGAVHYKDVCKLKHSMHNGTQQVYVCYGVIGIFIFLLATISFKRRYINHKSSMLKINDYIPLLTCVLFNQSIQFLMPYYLMFPFIATILPLKFKK